MFFFAGAQAVTKAISRNIKNNLNIFVALDITTSGFESCLKIQHFYLKEKKCQNIVTGVCFSVV